jgi:hypothetical protein
MNRYKNTTQVGFLTIMIAMAAYFPVSATAQNGQGPNDTIRVHGCIEANGDTIPCSFLPPVYVYTRLTGKWKKYHAEWTRLRNAVYVTYPYAAAASRIMNDINSKLIGVTEKSKRKAIIRSREKELKREFSDKLTKLSVYQGKVLMKLINRQTGNNCYEIIEEYKGSFTATVYQTVAIVFGSNLKQSYEPSGQDREIESIVHDVERMYGIR